MFRSIPTDQVFVAYNTTVTCSALSSGEQARKEKNIWHTYNSKRKCLGRLKNHFKAASGVRCNHQQPPRLFPTPSRRRRVAEPHRRPGKRCGYHTTHQNSTPLRTNVQPHFLDHGESENTPNVSRNIWTRFSWSRHFRRAPPSVWIKPAQKHIPRGAILRTTRYVRYTTG